MAAGLRNGARRSESQTDSFTRRPLVPTTLDIPLDVRVLCEWKTELERHPEVPLAITNERISTTKNRFNVAMKTAFHGLTYLEQVMPELVKPTEVAHDTSPEQNEGGSAMPDDDGEFGSYQNVLPSPQLTHSESANVPAASANMPVDPTPGPADDHGELTPELGYDEGGMWFDAEGALNMPMDLTSGLVDDHGELTPELGYDEGGMSVDADEERELSGPRPLMTIPNPPVLGPRELPEVDLAVVLCIPAGGDYYYYTNYDSLTAQMTTDIITTMETTLLDGHGTRRKQWAKVSRNPQTWSQHGCVSNAIAAKGKAVTKWSKAGEDDRKACDTCIKKKRPCIRIEDLDGGDDFVVVWCSLPEDLRHGYDPSDMGFWVRA